MAVVMIACFSLLWLPVIPLFGNQLFIYIQKPPSYVAPPILAMFLSGLFLPGVTGDGAFAGLILGVAAGLLRFGFELLEVVQGGAGSNSGNNSTSSQRVGNATTVPPAAPAATVDRGWFVSIHYLYFSIVRARSLYNMCTFIRNPHISLFSDQPLLLPLRYDSLLQDAA